MTASRRFWKDAPGTRAEAHFGDRVVTCFVDRPANADAMLRAAAAANPQDEAVVDGTVRISHAQLDTMSDGVAGGLASRGVAKGDRVGLLVRNRWQFVVALTGIVRAGAIAVPLSVRASAREIAFILDNCGAGLTICDAEKTKILPDTMPRAAIDGPADNSFEDLLAEAPTAKAPDVTEEDVAVILYTSGTTGTPKGAMLTHLNIVHSCLHYAHCFALTAADRSVVAVPASHVTGLIASVYAPLAAGAAVVMMEKFDADAFLALATDERMTVTILVPAMYNLCLLRADFARHDLGAWRIGAFGGAPMPVATIERIAKLLPNLDLIQAYGSTETTSPATIMPPGGQAAAPASVGAPAPCAEIRVMDAAGHEVATRESGEVWIGGPMVVPGYWNLPEKTAESFHAGFWKSGDVGRFDGNGLLYIHDRLKDMINRGGYKVYSAEVENVLSFHPGVAEAAVVPRPDPVLGEKVHAFVHRSDPDLDEAALRTFCGERLSDYKVPDFFTFTSEPLPRNVNGKLMKQALRTRAAAADDRDGD
ncbi:class I adenylate-forming enzyme family protein [Aurantimonas sp. E1-2-R+4]|uniref:class I adenylate-forming enzyme family protein n=1 Tax=Aurantimonas sp. E1-2-R+4 TaxID=3113714 RepID=UPI002F95C683